MLRVLTILAEGFEEIEAVTPIDLLRRAGVEVITAALGEGIHVTGRNGLTLHADTTLATIREPDFDAILLPGGPGVKQLQADERLRKLLRQHHADGRWLAAICAAPVVLQEAGILAGHRHTAHHSVASQLPEMLPGERCVVDGRILTSRGAGTALEFGLLLIELLVSREQADEVKNSICA